MTRPKINKGPERYTIQQLRGKAESFINEETKADNDTPDFWIEKFLEYLEAQK